LQSLEDHPLGRSIGLTATWSGLSEVTRIDVWKRVRTCLDEYKECFKSQKIEDGAFLGHQVEGAVARLQFLRTRSLIHLSTFPSLEMVAGRLYKEVERVNRLVPKGKLSDKVNDLRKGILRRSCKLKEDFTFDRGFITTCLSDMLCDSAHPKVGFYERLELVKSIFPVNEKIPLPTLALLVRDGARRNLEESVDAESSLIY